MQSKKILPIEGHTTQVLKRVSGHQRNVDPQIHLNPSPATANGHMKRPRHRIRSSRTKSPQPTTTVPQPIPQVNVPIMPLGQEMHAYPGPAYGAPPILQAWNLNAICTLKDTPYLHQRVTQNNTLGAIPKIIRPPTSTPRCVYPQGSEPQP